MKRLLRTKKLFAFLRLHRHEIFDDGFQEDLEGMYRATGAGTEPLPPALLCMVVLLQAYTGVSDAEALELTVMDARWQLVLDCMNAESPVISQGALQKFRERLIAAGLDRRLLERTVELAKATKGLDWQKLPKDLHVAVDSRPLEGAGRVEDTINLLGHAARKIGMLAAKLTDLPVETIAREARIPIALYPRRRPVHVPSCGSRSRQPSVPAPFAAVMRRTCLRRARMLHSRRARGAAFSGTPRPLGNTDAWLWCNQRNRRLPTGACTMRAGSGESSVPAEREQLVSPSTRAWCVCCKHAPYGRSTAIHQEGAVCRRPVRSTERWRFWRWRKPLLAMARVRQ